MTDVTVTQAAASVAETAPAAPPRRKATFAGSSWFKDVALQFPLEFDGKIYDSIRVTALTVAEYQTFADSGATRMPMFKDVAGIAIPEEVLDGLALVDSGRVNEAATGFLPSASTAEAAPAQ